jgi:transcriptional regulator with XRE-family HTH domain
MIDIESKLTREKKKLALKIEKTLLDKHLTQRELARRIGMKESYLSELMAGQVNPTLKTIVLLEVGLGEKLVVI